MVEERSLDATPKLLLSRLPSKAKDPIIMQTPPVNSNLASIPFQWEEVPGKPRPTTTTRFPCNKIPAVARCLELPPRLLNNENSANKVSPENTFHSQSKGSFVSLVKDVVTQGKDDDDDEKMKGCDQKSKIKRFGNSFGSFKGSIRSQKSGPKICSRVRRKSSFLGISNASSTLWAGIYGSFNQVVPWRWRQQ